MIKKITLYDDDDYELEITGDYSLREPGCHTQKNGDPGWPEEPESFEISEVKRDGYVTKEYNVTPPDGRDVLTYLEDLCLEQISQEGERDEYEAEE